MGNESRVRSLFGYACFSVLLLCAALLFVFVSTVRVEANYEKGVAARAAGDYEEALNQWMVASDDARCMTAIGSLYDYGEGLSRDEAKAVEWYTKAAEKGEYRAIAQLANFSLTGAGGVEQNPIEWRKKLEEVEGEDAYSDYILASFYLEGHGGEKDVGKAHAILDALVNTRGYFQLSDELKRAEVLLTDQKTGALSAEALINEMVRDRTAFEEKHKDRRIIVNGRLRSAERMDDYGYVVKFGGVRFSAAETNPGDDIGAVFYDREGALSSLEPGMLVRFSGVYVGDHPFQLGECAFTLFGCSLIDVISEDQRP